MDPPQDGTKLELTEMEVYEALNSLDASKAMGLDGIGPNVLKFCSLALCVPLLHLFQQCLDHHTIPQEWKLHRIIPIHKSADKAMVQNRPIFLLSSTSKVLERLVHTKCTKAIVSNLSDSQFGFLEGRCIMQQLLLVFHKILESAFKQTIWILLKHLTVWHIMSF